MEPVKISFDYTLIRSKRKTVSVRVEPVKGVVVKAPLGYMESQVLSLLKKHEQKIRIAIDVQMAEAHKLEYGSTFLYLGEHRSVMHEDINQLEVWLKKEAVQIIGERVIVASEAMEFNPQKVSFRAQKTRWGSCTSKGHISLNWKLIFAPVEVIDYVIIHELSHLKHMNHSSAFWEQVRLFSPDYEQHRKWLNKHSHLAHWPYKKS